MITRTRNAIGEATIQIRTLQIQTRIRIPTTNRRPWGVSLEQARKIALETISGQIVKVELESKRGRSIYEFYIRKGNGKMFEVYVDAATGRIVKAKIESGDNG